VLGFEGDLLGYFRIAGWFGGAKQASYSWPRWLNKTPYASNFGNLHMNSISLAFSGNITEKELYENSNIDIDIPEKYILNSLRENSKNISYKIRSKIIRQTGLECDATVSFKEGCIEWQGFVEVFYQSIQVMANVGGAIAFIQLVKSAVNSSVSEGFEQSIPRKKNRQISLDNYENRIEPTFDIETTVKNVTPIDSNSFEYKNIAQETVEKKVIVQKESDTKTLLYIILILSIIANIAGFAALVAGLK